MAEGAVFDAQAVTDAVAEGIAKIENASSMEELKAIKTQYAGAESAMTQASKAIGALPKDQKKDAGKIMGKLRADFGRAYGTKEQQVKAEDITTVKDANFINSLTGKVAPASIFLFNNIVYIYSPLKEISKRYDNKRNSRTAPYRLSGQWQNDLGKPYSRQ